MKQSLADRLKVPQIETTDRDQFPNMKLAARVISLIILACTQAKLSVAAATPIAPQASSGPQGMAAIDPELFNKLFQLFRDLATTLGDLNEQFEEAGLPKLVLSEPIIDMDPDWNVTATPPIKADSAP